MKYKILLLGIICIIAIILFVYHPGEKDKTSSIQQSMSFGEKVQLDAYDQDRKLYQRTYKRNPQKIAAIYQNSVETILALNHGETLFSAVNVNKELLNSKYKDLYEKIPVKLNHGISREELLMQNLDLIVGWYSTFEYSILGSQTFWRERGIDTYIAPSSFGRKEEPQVLEDEYRFIMDLGKILHKEDVARQIIGEMEKNINEVVSYAEKENLRPRCLIMEFEGAELRIYGKNTLGGNILMHLGVPLAYEGNHLDYESLIMVDPDIIFVVNLDETEEGGRREENLVYSQPAFSGIKAVKNHRVYQVPLYEIYCSGIRSYDAILYFSRCIYPDQKGLS